jgi:hypothetical protein
MIATYWYKVASFLYVGNPNNIYESTTHIAPHSLTVFYEVKNGTGTPILGYHWPSILAGNPVRAVEGLETGKKLSACFRTREFVPKEKRVRVHIWDSGLGPATYTLVSSCSKGSYDGGTGAEFYYREPCFPVPKFRFLVSVWRLKFEFMLRFYPKDCCAKFRLFAPLCEGNRNSTV